MTALVWYRNDLRVEDHWPLARALASGLPVQAVWLWCERQWDRHDVAPLRRWYVLESLRELGRRLAGLGVKLELLECDDFASAPAVLEAHVRRHRVTDVYCNREYPLNEARRDRAVAERLYALSVRMHGDDDAVIVPPRTLRTGQGTPYTVFTPYRRAWQRHLAEQPPTLPPQPRAGTGAAVRFRGGAAIDRALEGISVSQRAKCLWQPGEVAARRAAGKFVATGLEGYRRERDFPALEATSRLSPALSAGTLAPLRCHELARHAMADEPVLAEGARTWIGELAWRDFYRQIMAHYPGLARGEPFREEGRYLQWSGNEDHFRAWCDGRTGFPLVDAAMRQLNETGWMHNRLRMLVAMFLTKHLFIHWSYGERYFMQRLIDGDFAANNGGWLWSASLGTDAVPYFRVFSPVRQSERFDPRGEFIRRFVPELSALDKKTIHTPWKQPLLAPEYPAPLVDHSGVRERVGAAFREARKQVGDRASQ